MMAMLQMPCRPCSPACHGLLWCRATAHTQLGASRASSPVSRRRQRLARCTALQHAQADALVSDILQEIKDTDGGLNIRGDKRQAVDGRIRKLAETGAEQQPRPLDSPLIWGNYDVAYVSAGDSQYGAPAGGKFRGRLGRAIFRTTAVCQSVLQPDLVINKVSFKLLGLLAGYIGLRGRLQVVGDAGDTVKVQFEPPELSLGSAVVLRIGPSSSVQLTTTYLDKRVRLGEGSRGSLFVFRRGGVSDREGMETVGLGKSSALGVVASAAVLAGLAASAAALWQSPTVAARTCSVAIFALLLAMCGLLWRGGLARDYEKTVTT